MKNIICNVIENEEFNPLDFLTTRKDAEGVVITDEQGLPVMRVQTEAQKLWFRLKYPLGSLETEVQFKPDLGLVMAKAVVSAEGTTLSTAHDYACIRELSGLELENTIKACETGALSRALESAGFGCESKLNKLLLAGEDIPISPVSIPTETTKEEPVDEFAQFGISPIANSWDDFVIDCDNTSGIPDKYLGKKIPEYSSKQLRMFVDKAKSPRTEVELSEDLITEIENYLAQAV